MPTRLHHVRAIANAEGLITSVDVFDEITNTDADGDTTSHVVQSSTADASLLAALNALGTAAARRTRKEARRAAREAAAAVPQ